MRAYMTKEYMNHLTGNTLVSTASDLKIYNGLKVIEILRELTEDEYDRELVDDTDRNENGEFRYLINTMYQIRLENDKIVTVFEDEINPEYTGSWETRR